MNGALLRTKFEPVFLMIGHHFIYEKVVPGGGIEPPTRGFSVRCSTPELPGPLGVDIGEVAWPVERFCDVILDLRRHLAG